LGKDKLTTEINVGLDAGLTINEIKESMVQLYAYCGFPRSLNAIASLREVLDQRRKKGIVDLMGKDDNPLTDTAGRYEIGRKVLEQLTQTPQAKPAPGFGEFAPRIDAFLKEHLFADIICKSGTQLPPTRVCDHLSFSGHERYRWAVAIPSFNGY